MSKIVFNVFKYFCSVLLSAVSGEDTQDRTDRLLLTPWVKFLWESYRQCLDLLRNNSRVERLYHDIAQQGKTRTDLKSWLKDRFCKRLTVKVDLLFSVVLILHSFNSYFRWLAFIWILNKKFISLVKVILCFPLMSEAPFKVILEFSKWLER